VFPLRGRRDRVCYNCPRQAARFATRQSADKHSKPLRFSLLNDIGPRLTQCFSIVFPDLSEAEIPRCTQKTMLNWDSAAAITLLNVIEEEFSTSIDLELLPELNSYEAFAKYLAKQP